MTEEIQDPLTTDCPECGTQGSYQGHGRSELSNWKGQSFAVYQCPDCGNRWKCKR